MPQTRIKQARAPLDMIVEAKVILSLEKTGLRFCVQLGSNSTSSIKLNDEGEG